MSKHYCRCGQDIFDKIAHAMRNNKSWGSVINYLIDKRNPDFDGYVPYDILNTRGTPEYIIKIIGTHLDLLCFLQKLNDSESLDYEKELEHIAELFHLNYTAPDQFDWEQLTAV